MISPHSPLAPPPFAPSRDNISSKYGRSRRFMYSSGKVTTRWWPFVSPGPCSSRRRKNGCRQSAWCRTHPHAGLRESNVPEQDGEWEGSFFLSLQSKGIHPFALFGLFRTEGHFHRFVVRFGEQVHLPVRCIPGDGKKPLPLLRRHPFIEIFEQRPGIKELLKV